MTMNPDIAPETDNVRLLPGEGQGTLTTPGGGRLPVRTFKRGSDVVLVVLDESAPERADDRMEAAELEYSSVRGVVRLHGQAIFEGRTLIRFEPRSGADVTQRRAFVRVRAPQGVTLDVGQGEQHVQTLDLSGGGMLLTGDHALEPDQVVRFTIGLADGLAPVEGVARVVRVEDPRQCALAFEQISESDRDRLIRFVFDCMRATRARTRGDWF